MTQVIMIKVNGKMVPARKDENGKYVPIENAALKFTKDGFEVVQKDEANIDNGDASAEV